MRRTFSKARDSAPCILFIDETDSFPNRATITHHYVEWETQVVNGLLAEIDGVEGREGVVVIGACNHPEKLDPALIRSGRFDRHIRLSLPDRPALSAICASTSAQTSKVWICRRPLWREPGEPELTARSGCAAHGDAHGREAGTWSRGSARRDRRRGKQNGRGVVDCGGARGRARRCDQRSPARHRPGRVHPRGRRRLHRRRDDAVQYLRETDLQQHLIILLAGRAAEEEVLGVASSGAGGQYGSDLERATWLAVTADTAFGFAAGGGLLWRGMPDARELPAIFSRQMPSWRTASASALMTRMPSFGS